jgi:cation:H+ antiporter
MTVSWITFSLSSIAIILAGSKLASFGEGLSKASGLGQGWIGLLFLATITSIPEVTTTVTGGVINVPNIAVGNALGSNLFNLAIIGVVDILLFTKGPFLSKVRPYHAVSGGIVVLLSVLVILGIATKPTPIYRISPISLVIALVYVLGIVVLYRVEKGRGGVDGNKERTMSLARAVSGFVFCGIVIIIAGVFLIYASKTISLELGFSGPFMGAILVAVVTSLPELATSIGAFRIGAYDMIMGNLLGSNMFNILTIFLADIAFRRGAILSHLGEGGKDQLLVATVGILLAVITIVAISCRSRRRIVGIGASGILILAIYLASVYLISSREVIF